MSRTFLRLTCAILFLAILSPLAWGDDKGKTTHVLILNSYHPGNKWSDDILAGIQSSLKASDKEVRVHIEYMDTKNYPDYDHAELSQHLAQKYANTDIDLVIASDDNAFNFVKEYRGISLFDAPFVFCGVNYVTSSRLSGLENMTGVSEAPDLEKTIDLILDLHPKVERVIALTDMTTSGQVIVKKIDQLRPFYFNKVKLVSWANLSRAELIEKLDTLSDRDVVLFTFLFRDRLGHVFTARKIVEEITKASPAPVYGGWDFSLGHGIVGGKLASGFYQGQKAGELASEIMDGKSASSLPVVMQSPNRYMFDEEVLERFHIDKASLPAGAIFINHKPTFMEDHGTIVFSFLGVSVVFLTIIHLLSLNIARRKQAEGKLRISETRYHDLVELLPQTVFEMNTDKRITYMNQFGLSWSGYSQSDFLSGDLVERMTHPEDRPRLRRNLAEIFKGGQLRGNTYRIVKEDGSIAQVLSYSRTYQKEDGTVGIRGVLTDVSDLKKAEAEAALVRTYLKGVVNLMPMVLIGVDVESNISLWNEQAVEVFGITPEGAQGQSLTDVLPLLKPEQGLIERSISEHIPLSETRVLKVISNIERYWDIYIYPLLLPELESAIVVINDVSEQVQMEKMLIQSEKMMSVGGLAAGMAHEINNPLAAILQNIQVMSRRLLSSTDKNSKAAEEVGVTLDRVSAYIEHRKIPEMFESINQAGGRIADIVHDMLSFSRSDDSSGARKELADIHKLIDMALSFARKDHIHYDFNKISIQKDYGELPAVFCSETQILQVLLNIIKNGAEAMVTWSQMEEEPRLTIKTEATDKCIRVAIEDNGPGISKRVQQRIFEPFYTTKGVGVGTGLGLSISYFIITNNHGGVLDLVSAPGEGTKFVIELPIG